MVALRVSKIVQHWIVTIVDMRSVQECVLERGIRRLSQQISHFLSRRQREFRDGGQLR